MAEVINLSITSNVSEFPYEKKLPSDTTLAETKKKLMPIVGAAPEHIGIELRDRDGKFVSSLTNDVATLHELGVRDGMQLYATDLSGGNIALQDASMVEKYEITEDAYSKRDGNVDVLVIAPLADSVRAFKKKMQENPDFVKRQEEEMARWAATIKIGQRCVVRVSGERHGAVAFVGRTQFKDGLWVGVHYDEAVGKNDGSVQGVRYFECPPLHGGFVRPQEILPEENRDSGDSAMDEL